MSTPPHDEWEARVQHTARQLRYPPTPDLVRAVHQRIKSEQPRLTGVLVRRWAWAAAAVVIICSSVLAVPDVRAALRAWWRIGVIEIVQPAPNTSPTPFVSRAPATPAAPPAPLRGLAGATPLDDARAQVPFPIKLPAYPADLGPPDHVYVQDLDGPAVVSVWLDPHDPADVRLSLHALSSTVFAQKIVGERLVDEVRVNGTGAAWVHGDHLLQFRDSSGNLDYRTRRFVSGNVLIWEEADITYRLETDRSLEEAIRIAESLR